MTPTELGKATDQFNQEAGGIALDATSVYWSDEYTVYQCPKSGCGTTPLDLGLPGGDKILVDGTRAYTLAGSQQVWGCTLTNCGKTAQPFSAVISGEYFYDLALDGTNLYWPQDQTVLACAEGGCSQTPSALTVLSDQVRWLAADGKCVFMQTPESSYIYEVAAP